MPFSIGEGRSFDVKKASLRYKETPSLFVNIAVFSLLYS